MGSNELVYATEHPRTVGADEVDLQQLGLALWNAKWVIITVTVLFAVGALAYALLAERWWRVEVVLATVDEKPSTGITGQLGSLAALAGLNVGASGTSADALAILRSRDFLREFIAERDLLPILFADEWDPGRKTWRSTDPDEQRDLRDGVRYFQKHVFRVAQDRQTKLVTLTVEWTDPEVAAEWASALVERINARMRLRAVDRAQTNLAYLQAELAKTSVVAVQAAIGRMMEQEMQTLMLAGGNNEFAFRTLEPAAPPKFHARPVLEIVVPIGTIMGLLVGATGVIVGLLWRVRVPRDI